MIQIIALAVLFLSPPSRRPYELHYFCNFEDEVIIVTDKETFSKYSDSFDEFERFNFQYFFVSTQTRLISKLLRLGSTAALVAYDEIQLAKIIQAKKISTIVSVEVFSSLSEQASKLSEKFSLKHIVIVWENIKRSIFYVIPPFSSYTKIVKSKASRFITVSATSRQSMEILNIQKDKVETIYPGILLENFRESEDSSDKILFVGNLEPNKGITILLRAFEKLSADRSDIRLIVVGKGTLESKINKLKKAGSKIEYKGYVSRSKLSSIYAECSVFCSPSVQVKRAGVILTWEEQFGFTLVEAMASGLPIVSSNIGTIPEIVGENNFTVQPDIESVSSALDLLLTCDILRKKLRRQNRERSITTFDALKQSSLFEKAIYT
jgi:glycosyltransferase involved in cell wall biosynthesis